MKPASNPGRPSLGSASFERFAEWGEPVMLSGAAVAAYGLAFVAAEGFAPDGHFPWLTALIFAVGVILAALRPTKVSRRSVEPAPRTG